MKKKKIKITSIVQILKMNRENRIKDFKLNLNS